MVLNFDYEAYFDELKATKPPYKCPFKTCQKVYKTFSGIQYHVITTHRNNSGAKNGQSKASRWHHRQLKSPMTPPKSVSSIENGSLDEMNDKSQSEDEDSNIKFINIKINDKLHKLNESDDILVTVCQENELPLNDMDTTVAYSIRNLDRSNIVQSDNAEDAILKELPKKPIPIPSFKLLKDYLSNSNDYSEFEMPTEYITFKSASDDGRNETADYCLDEEDRMWLKLQSDVPLDERRLEIVIDKLEKASYFVTRGESKLHHHNNSNTSTSSNTGCSNSNKPVDDNALCSICYDGSCTSNNTILFCDMCDMGVHQECYGVPYVPDGVWLCRRCLHSPSKELQCCLCPSPGGVLKQTVDGRWAHILCAAWVPEVHFANPVFLEPIDGLDTIPPARWRLMCFLCRRKRVGACIQCHRPNCYTAFHVSCAILAGLHLKMRSRSGSSTSSGIFISNHTAGSVKRTAYCDIHRPKVALDGNEDDDEVDNDNVINAADNDDDYEPMSKAKVDIMMKKRSMMTKMVMMKMKRIVHVLSYPTVTNSCFKMISNELSNSTCGTSKNDGDDTSLMNKIKNYWLLKRLSRNGVPLIRCLLHNLSPRNVTTLEMAGGNMKQDELQMQNRSSSKKLKESSVMNISDNADDEDDDDDEGEEDDIENLFVQTSTKHDIIKTTKPFNSKNKKIVTDTSNENDGVKQAAEDKKMEDAIQKKRRGRPPVLYRIPKLSPIKANDSIPNDVSLISNADKFNEDINSGPKKVSLSNNSTNQQKSCSSRLQYYANSFLNDTNTLKMSEKDDDENDGTNTNVLKRSKRHRRLSSYLVDYTFFKSIKKRKLNNTSSSGDDSKISSEQTSMIHDIGARTLSHDSSHNVSFCTAVSSDNSPSKSDMSKSNVRIHLNKVNLDELKKKLKVTKNVNKEKNDVIVHSNITKDHTDEQDDDNDDKNDDMLKGSITFNKAGNDDDDNGDDVMMTMKKLTVEMHLLRKLLKMMRRREELKLQHIAHHQKLLFIALNPVENLLTDTLKQLKDKDHRHFFHEPVNIIEVPDYLDIISSPMDFSKMNQKLADHKYTHLCDFQQDFDLIIDNCMLYNAKTTVYYQAAVKLKQASISIFSEAERLQKEFCDDKSDVAHLLNFSAPPHSPSKTAKKKSLNGACNDNNETVSADADELKELEGQIERLKKKIDTTSCKSGKYLKELKVLHKKYTLMRRKRDHQSNHIIIRKSNNNDNNNNTTICDTNLKTNNHNNIFQNTRSSLSLPSSLRSNSISLSCRSLDTAQKPTGKCNRNRQISSKQRCREPKQLSLLESFSNLRNVKQSCVGELATALTTNQEKLNDEPHEISSTTTSVPSFNEVTTPTLIGSKCNNLNEESSMKINQFKDKLKSIINASCIKQLHGNNVNSSFDRVNIKGCQNNKVVTKNKSIVFDFRPHLETVSEFKIIHSSTDNKLIDNFAKVDTSINDNSSIKMLES